MLFFAKNLIIQIKKITIQNYTITKLEQKNLMFLISRSFQFVNHNNSFVTVIIQHCQTFLSRDQVSVRDISQPIEKLCYSAIAVLRSTIYYRYLQRQQLLEFSVDQSLKTKVYISSIVKKEFHWWVKNQKLSNGKSIVALKP